MTALKKFVTLFLCVFVILPILEARFHGDKFSYRQYYNNLINVVKYPVTKKTSEQPDYNRNGMEKGIKYSEGNSNYADFRFSNNGLQARNDYSNSIEKLSVPKDCRDEFTTCKNNQYPQEYVDQILREQQYLKAYAFEDGVNIDSRKDERKIKNYCSIMEGFHAPEQARNMYGEWNWIIQSDNQKFHQRIYYEKCIDTNCEEILNDYRPIHYVSKCVQRRVKRTLLALNGTNPELINFNLPVLCCCNVERSFK